MLTSLRSAVPSPALGGVLLLGLTLIGGCSEARDTSDPLGEIAEAYREAIRNHPAIPTAEETPDTPATLRTLARRASSASRDGNANAAEILSSGIHAKAGAIALTETQRVQSNVDITIDQISKLVADAIVLEGAKTSRENLDLSASDEILTESRSEARNGLTKSESALDDLRSPIDAAIDTRDARRERASELETEAASLARRGLDAGPLDGEGLIKESIDLRLQAHGKRIEAARENITLVDLEPKQRITEVHRTRYEGLLEAARNSESTLDDRRANAKAYAEALSSYINEIKTRVAPLLQQLATEQSQLILPGYEAAIADFAASSTAAREATRGSSPAQSNDAWLGVASGELSTGRAQWAMAGSLASQAALLRQLYASGDLLGDRNRWLSELESTQAAQQEALTAAKTSYEAALESLTQVRGLDAQTTMIRQNITTAIAAIDGADLISIASERRDSSTNKPRRSTPGRTTAASPNIDRSAPGFASVNDAAAALASPPTDLAHLEHLLASAQGNSPAATTILTLVQSFVDAVQPFNDAAMAKFGSTGSESPFSSLGGQISMDGEISIQEESGDSATLVMKGDGEEEDQTATLLQQNGRWFLDADSMLPDDPEMAQMIPMLGMMLSPMMAEIKTATTKLASQIEAGDFASADEASEAMSDVIAEIFSGLLDGAMGGGAGGGFPGGGGGFPGGGFPSGS